MAAAKRNQYSLLTYYCPLSVSNETHDLLRNLPAFITTDPTEYCHYYVQPNLFIHKTPNNAIKNRGKYGSRSQRMWKMTKQTNDHKETQKQDLMRNATVMKMLKEKNPKIQTILESKLKHTIKQLIDNRADNILSQRKQRKKDEISYFLLDKYGIYEPDEGYHIQTVERFHFGGNYGPDYQGTFFVDPKAYRAKKRAKKKQPNHKNTNNVAAKRESKVCHGCRHKYFEDEWDTHILSEAHQKYLTDPAFVDFVQYLDELNERLKREDQQQQIQQKEHEMNTKQSASKEEETDTENTHVVLRRSKRIQKRKYSAVMGDLPQRKLKKRKFTIDLGCAIIDNKLSFISWPALNINNHTDFDDDVAKLMVNESNDPKINGHGSSLEMLPLVNINEKMTSSKGKCEDKKNSEYAEKMRSHRKKRRGRRSSIAMLEMDDLIECCRRSQMRDKITYIRQNGDDRVEVVYYECIKCSKIWREKPLCA